MHNLLDFLLKYCYWFLFILLEVFSLMLVFSFNNYQGSVFFTSANNLAGKVYKAESKITSYIHLQEVNKQLVDDNVKMRLRIAELERAAAVNKADSSRLAFLPTTYNTVNAQVVKSQLHNDNNLITIDKGYADGVKPEMGVVTSSGIVGIVYLTSKHYAIVIPAINVRSHISCRMRNSKYFGTLEWKRGAVNISYVNDVPRHADVRQGEIVETNGYSDVFPAGIPVGTILKVEDSPDGLSYALKIKLFTDFTKLRDVCVITNYNRSEKDILEQKVAELEKDR